jgi:maleylacetoacetate isomerase
MVCECVGLKMSEKVVLFSYWRSSSTWRVRIALALKGIKYEYKTVQLLKEQQKTEDYVSLNPTKKIPTLIIDGHTLIESPSILEYLEETRPEPPLLPKDPYQRAVVRQIVALVTCDIQPLQNLSVLKRVGEEKKQEWAQYYISEGFEALEKILQKSAGEYCVGNQITLADCVLVPQVYNANRFGVDVSKYPIISRINAKLLQHEAIKQAHPDAQPDAGQT